MTKPIGVLIASDHPIVCASLRAVVESAPDIIVVGEAASGDEAVEGVRALPDDDSCDRVDLVLIDLRFGETSGAAIHAGGVDATTAIRALARHGVKTPEVLVVTNYSSDSDILGTVAVGAVGYLLKDAASEELIDGIRHAIRGGAVLNIQMAGHLMGRMRNPNTVLAPRELEALESATRGMSNRKIAEQLVLTETTVKSHLVYIFTKLNVSSRTTAIARTQELGILDE